MLKFMYITKSPETAVIAEKAGTDRIFVDLEKIGKELRQGGMNTVKSDHTVEDVKNIRSVLKNAELLVRVNPVYEQTKEEIRSVTDAGADIIMLPYFKTKEEVEKFLYCCQGKVKTMLLVETRQAAENLDSILSLGGIDSVHIGINDLHLDLHKKFMFELLCDGTVENICKKCRDANIPYGFGGVAGLGKGLLPAEYVLAEHYRQHSSAVILSRSFCDLSVHKDIADVREIFENGVAQLRSYERKLASESPDFFEEKHREMTDIIKKITEVKV